MKIACISLIVLSITAARAFPEDVPVPLVTAAATTVSRAPVVSARALQDKNSIEAEEFDFANGLFSRGMYDMAVEEYKKFIEAYPDSSYRELADFRAGESFFMDKEYSAAETWFEAFLAGDPAEELLSKAQLRLAQIGFFKNEFEKSLSTFKRLSLVVKYPEVASAAKYYIANINFKSAKYPEAIVDWEKIASDYPSSEYAAYSYMRLGETYAKLKEIDKAIAAYKRAADTTDNKDFKAEASIGEAEAYYDKGDHKTSADLFAKAITVTVKSELLDEAILGLFSSYYKDERYPEIFEMASSLIPRIKDRTLAEKARYILGNSYFNLDKFAEAADIYGKLVKDDPAGEYGKKSALNLLWASFKSGDLDGALNGVNGYLAGGGEIKEEAAYIKAKVLVKKGLEEEGIAAYLDVLSGDARSEYYKEALYDLGWLYANRKQLDESVTFCKRFVATFPEDPRSPEVLIKVAQDEMKIKKYADAESDYLLFLSTYGKNPLKEKVMFQLGRVYMAAGKNKELVELYGNFVREYPGSEAATAAVFWIGHAYQGLGEWDKAIDAFNGLLAKKDGEYYNRSRESIGYSYFKKGEFKKAAGAYLDILRTSPDHEMSVDIYQWTAEYYFSKEESDLSLEVLSALEKANPDAAANGVHMFLVAENERRKGRTGEALQDLGKAMEYGLPGAYRDKAYLSMGRCHLAAGDNEKALSAFEESLRQHTDNLTGASARYEIGNIKRLQKKYEEAAKAYMMVAILYDDKDLCPKSLFNAGACFEVIGKQDKARDVYLELIKRYPDDAMALEAEKKLEGELRAKTQ
ncbi:MAG: tetratricopeptide repeat protein [Candidatus Omnitrophica bacterium]|nr:tetratricopeptide repeat protein [Candidatus Omnitrophota bacterium]